MPKIKITLLLATASFAVIYAHVLIAQSDAKPAQHLGVASCAGSTCHGSAVAFDGSSIRRNEFRVWNESDPHARAYATLLTKESQRMARNLNIGPAENAPECLGCHADNVTEGQRGDNFKLADGVGCEACHGGGSDYLEPHTRGNYQNSVKAGLYPTADPHQRAKLCVSCHVGNNSDRKITHTIMGAGHPRLSFELNTFTSIQPAHYQQDDDYRQRKGDISDLQVWAVGQVVAAEQFLSNVRSFPSSGLFPELVHMDCHSCHESMNKLNWSLDPLVPLEAGALRYNDAYLTMSLQISRAVAPELASSLLRNLRVFLAEAPATSRKARGALAGLQTDLQQLREQLTNTPVTAEQSLSLLKSLVEIGLLSSHRDYAKAEQSAMAINSVLRVLDQQQGIASERTQVVRAVDRVFLGLNDAENYRPQEFIRGLRQIQAALLN